MSLMFMYLTLRQEKTRYSCLVLGPLSLSVSPHLKKNLLTAILDSTNEQKVPWCENLGYLVKKKNQSYFSLFSNIKKLYNNIF